MIKKILTKSGSSIAYDRKFAPILSVSGKQQNSQTFFKLKKEIIMMTVSEPKTS